MIVVFCRFIVFAQGKVAVASIVVIVRIFRANANRFAEVLHGGVIASCIKVDAAPVDIVFGVLRAEFDGRRIIFKGDFFSFEPAIGIATVVIRLRVLGIQPDNFAVVLDRLIVLAQIIVGVAAIEIGVGKFRIGLERAVVLADRLFGLSGIV